MKHNDRRSDGKPTNGNGPSATDTDRAAARELRDRHLGAIVPARPGMPKGGIFSPDFPDWYAGISYTKDRIKPEPE